MGSKNGNKTVVGVIGCGYWGPNHIRSLMVDRRTKVKYVCDLSAERLAHIKGLYPGIAPVKDYIKILMDPEVDAIVIATPAATHYRFAKDALKSGKHVLIEKPMTTSIKDAKELESLAKIEKKILMIGYTFLFHKCVQRIKKTIDTGELGELYYINMQRLNLGLLQKDINVVWDLASHDISILFYLLKARPVSVSAIGKSNIYSPIEDVAVVTLKYSNGLLVYMHLSWIDPHKVRRSVFVGSKKMLLYDDVENIYKIKIYDKCVTKPKHYDTFADFQFAYRYGEVRAPLVQFEEPLKVECRHFIDCIREQREPFCNGAFGLEVVKVLEAAQKSIKRNGCWIPIVA